jgi:hypothetical protein
VVQFARRSQLRVQAGGRHDATKRASDVGSVESSSVLGAEDEVELYHMLPALS